MNSGDLLLHKRYGGIWMFVEDSQTKDWIFVISLCKKNLPYLSDQPRKYEELKKDFIMLK
jgi:hypothetical protein